MSRWYSFRRPGLRRLPGYRLGSGCALRHAALPFLGRGADADGRALGLLAKLLVALDLCLQLDEPIDHHLRPWWTARHIDVHRHDPVDPLDERIVVVDAAAGGAGAHREHPLGL